MVTQTSYAHGTFSWIELNTTDATKAKRFYADLLGWTFEDRPAGPGMTYSMVKLGERLVGGLFELTKEMAAVAPSHWGSFITVDDVDETAKKVVAHGGKLIDAPFDVMDVGRMAVAEDPTGAIFRLWTAKTRIGAEVMNEPGSLCWNELYTTDVDAARKFYDDVIGWQTDAVDMGSMGTYTLLKVPGQKKNLGGILAMPPGMKDAPSHWLVYIEVEDCDASTKRANDLGGKTLMAPMDIPNTGRFSIVQDPTGAVFALYKNSH
jgi:predicted enzyme related to lactoylglutathione lyase